MHMVNHESWLPRSSTADAMRHSEIRMSLEAPEFHFQHDEEKRSFNVSVSRTQDAYARLCYKNDICKDLEGSGKLLVKASESVSLPYEDLLPCLCIEVFYTYRNSRRKQKCPFKEHAERYAADLLRVSATAIKYHDNTMMALFKNPCGEKPDIHLCRLHNGICSTIPGADIEERHGRYSIVGIDCNPDLCFKFTLLNHTYIKCPHRDDRVWNVTVEAGLRHVLLQTFSSVPSASFSAAICTWDQRNGSCTIKLPVYNFSATRQTKEKQLSIPWPGLGRCIQVWRTDVHFASKHVICSWDYSHKRLGLVALVTLLVVFMVTLLLFLSCRRIWKIFTAPLWRRTILLVYSPDSAEYKNFICVFADFLQNILGCEVILDMWDMNTISQTGMIAWFYQKRELVSQRKGKVMIVWTARTKSMYQQWMNRNANNNTWKDPANLFGAAMSCLNRDLSTGQKHFKLKEYSIVYFEGLCEKKDIPKNLKRISKFRLFKDLYRLVSRLQDTTCLSPPCLIKAAAKYLIRKLMHSKKKQGLQDHIDICKQKLLEEGSLEKNKMATIVL
ncbi:interleukin-17 receptor E [Gastrophryne carolinensis]